ncbi:fatty acyl-AMP ligase [Kitasatospora sp. NPDC058965]|uniref:fatty acyl-AMP ligase n=1 Tax=Kitasatospora sp. NPDC058965 TaxID=3346682 RepID=UPI0036C4BAFD
MREPSTFTEVVRERAQAAADAQAHVFLREREGELVPDTSSYADLDTAARRIAHRIQGYGVKGQPVVLLYPAGPEFLQAFLGCLYAGAVAVPATLPGGHGQLERLGGIIRDTRATLFLTDTAHAPEISLWLAMEGVPDTVCLATDTAGFGDPEAWQPVRTGSDDLAFLQYTSGSTADPRGVMVSHANLIANQQVIQQSMGTDERDVLGGWLPHFHDMGLILHLLHPLWIGGKAVQLSPTSFLKRPVRWLQAISDYRVTAGGGPNFCYDLCLRRITPAQQQGLDLSSWRMAFNGAEPVRSSTLDAFAARFAENGLRPEALYPCYGLAEATLMVSGPVPGEAYTELAADAAALEQGRVVPAAEGAQTRPVVSVGRVVDLDLRIVDPVSRAELGPGEVGEIWVGGDSVAQGYWHRPNESRLTFHATVEHPLTPVAGGFLRTGDLGTVDEQDRLYITGRLKETIIINGRNLFPQDIEWAIRELGPAFSFGAAFTVDAGVERLVIVQEVRAGEADWARLREKATAVQALIGREFAIPAANVLLVKPGSVSRTTSGKIRRARTRERFLSGELTGAYEILEPEVRALVRPNELAGLGAWQ